MSPMFDYSCQCGNIEEKMESSDVDIIKCSKCGANAKKIISVSGVHTANQDSVWVRSVREVVEKNSGKPHCEEFLKNPTRENYNRWMKGEGLRHLEPGEKTQKPDEGVVHRRVTKEVYGKHRRRCAIEI